MIVVSRLLKDISLQSSSVLFNRMFPISIQVCTVVDSLSELFYSICSVIYFEVGAAKCTASLNALKARLLRHGDW